MNYVSSLLLISALFSANFAFGKLTETVFYKADPLIYTVDFCAKIEAKDFLEAIKPDTTKEANKAVAFKALFDGCRGRFLHDAAMAKHIIIPMVDTENTEHLPLLLDQPTLIDSNPEIENIVQHLFTINLSQNEKEYFFQVRNPDRALAYLLAYTKVSKDNVGRLRDMMENLKNHVSASQYVDAKSVHRSISVLDKYFQTKSEETGDRKFLLPVKKETNSETGSGSVWMAVSIILGIGSILAVILGFLWKFKQSTDEQ